MWRMPATILVMFIGLIAGLHSACWGLYKDSLYEKVVFTKFLRSIFYGILIALVLFFGLKTLNVSYNLGIFFGACILFERLFTEIYKGFFRVETQKKYNIPSLFHLGKHIIHSVFVKESLGFMLVLVVVGFGLLFHILTPTLSNLGPHILVGGLVGFFMGLLEAIGGAEKDAPFEGFEPLKVFRSPIVHGVWGIIFSFFTKDYGLILLASGGIGRMTIELYKTFIVKKTPGKFKAPEPVFTNWINKRKIVILPYVLTWTVFFILLFQG